MSQFFQEDYDPIAVAEALVRMVSGEPGPEQSIREEKDA